MIPNQYTILPITISRKADIEHVHLGSEMPQTASAAGRQKNLRAHRQDRAISGPSASQDASRSQK
jgi:hypothetical protein